MPSRRQSDLYPITLRKGGRVAARISQAAMNCASWLATQPLDKQKKLLLLAAEITPPRNLAGSGDGRFYFAALNMSPALARLLKKKTKHGQRIATADSYNGYCIFFDQELLIVAGQQSAHAQIAFHAAVEAARQAKAAAGSAKCADTATTAPSVAPPDVAVPAG